MRCIVDGVLSGLVAFVLAGAPVRAETPAAPGACQAGEWLEPAKGARIEHAAVLAKAAARRVVLLGETHDNAEHHRWQLATVAGLLAQGRPLVLGFEAFPRRIQPILDRWRAGELDAEAFLAAVDWSEVWGFDPNLYLPLFHFARMHRVPMVALNVDRALVSRVGDEGWAAIPPDERAGLGDPAPPTGPYLDRLEQSFGQHGDRRDGTADDPQAVQERPAFKRFVEAQLTWDRAMAEALAEARRREGDPVVVGIIGSEHLRYGHGVPHQLADLGVADAAVLLPEEADRCTEVTAGLADAVFLLHTWPDTDVRARPRLGVLLAAEAGEIRLTRVMADSIAEAAGLMAGDVVMQAAGQDVRRQRDLVEIVGHQAPGTWLPLLVRRGGEVMELIAKFPPGAGGGP